MKTSDMFSMRPPTDGRWIDCSEQEHHSDPCKVPSLSHSTAKVLLNESPAHAYAFHPRLGGHVRPPKAVYAAGNAIHAILLGTVEESLVVLRPTDFVKADGKPAKEQDFKTKAAKAIQDAAEAAGKTALTPIQFAGYQATADRLRAKLEERGIVFDGRTEQTVVWTEYADDGTPVPCRGRLDHYARGIIDDVKTGVAVNPKKLARSCVDNGYDLQAAAYTRAIEAIMADLTGRVRYRWIGLELSEPFSTTIARPSAALLSLGASRWRRAVNLWARCMRDDWWPEYDDGEEAVIEPTPWALNDEMAEWLEDEEEAAE